MTARWLLTVVLLALAPLCRADPVTIEPAPPRTFGYSIGDRIERRVEIRLEVPWTLAQASLPKPGRQNMWFELAEVTTQTDVVPTGTRIELRFVYQLLNSPVQPTVLLLPRVGLKFEGGPLPVERDVPPAEVFASPLLPAEATGSTLDTPRADRKPEAIAVERYQNRMTAYALAATFVLLWMWIALLVTRRRRAGPFVRACRELRRLAHAPRDPAQSAAAMRVVHRALDETAGHTVFLDNVDALFALPRRAPLRDRTREFLAHSRKQFFAGNGEPLPLEESRALARAWRALEAGR